MKKSKITEQQIVFALKQAETGISEVCRKMDILKATFFNWKRNSPGLGTQELRRLRQIEVEDSRQQKLRVQIFVKPLFEKYL